MFRILLSYKWAILWASLIFILCAIPGRDLPKADWMQLFQLDKWVHAGMFLILYCLGAWEHTVRGKRVVGLLWVGIGVCYGLALEFMQDLVFVERSFDIYDVAADAAGAISGLFIFPWIRKRWSKPFGK